MTNVFGGESSAKYKLHSLPGCKRFQEALCPSHPNPPSSGGQEKFICEEKQINPGKQQQQQHPLIALCSLLRSLQAGSFLVPPAALGILKEATFIFGTSPFLCLLLSLFRGPQTARALAKVKMILVNTCTPAGLRWCLTMCDWLADGGVQVQGPSTGQVPPLAPPGSLHTGCFLLGLPARAFVTLEFGSLWHIYKIQNSTWILNTHLLLCVGYHAQ